MAISYNYGHLEQLCWRQEVDEVDIVRAFAILVACLLFAVPCQARVIYVDANTLDNNDGSSWMKAYKYL